MRRAFTLTELLIVIALLLILATISLAVYGGRSTDKMRSGARVGQSAFLGAKDRAMHAKDFRGVRLVRDSNGPTFSATNLFPALVTGFVYLQPISLQPIGNLSGQPKQFSVSIQRPTVTSDATLVVITPSQGVALLAQDIAHIWPRSSVQVRIPSGSSATPGQWYNLAPNPNATNGAYWVSTDAGGNQNLVLQTGFNGGSSALIAIDFPDPRASIDIQVGNELLPFHQPVVLPSSVVIDLRYCSGNVILMAGGTQATGAAGQAPYIDFNFSPRGNVAGATGGLGNFYFCVRDLRDATGPCTLPLANSRPSAVPGQFVRDPSDPHAEGDCLILAVNPATGLVQTYEADLRDNFNNLTNAAGPDGVSDNLFSFAQQGKSAGR